MSRSLIAACADNDVSTVRRLLGDGNNTINEGTDDGESLLSLACSAGYFELAQVIKCAIRIYVHFVFLKITKYYFCLGIVGHECPSRRSWTEK